MSDDGVFGINDCGGSGVGEGVVFWGGCCVYAVSEGEDDAGGEIVKEAGHELACEAGIALGVGDCAYDVYFGVACTDAGACVEAPPGLAGGDVVVDVEHGGELGEVTEVGYSYAVNGEVDIFFMSVAAFDFEAPLVDVVAEGEVCVKAIFGAGSYALGVRD